MTNLKRKSRLSVRKSHPDLRQGGLLEGNGSIPQKKRKSCANGDSEWGPRYRSSEEEERVLYHRSWCGVEEKGEIYGYIPTLCANTDTFANSPFGYLVALFSGKSRTGEDEQWKAVVLKAPCGRGLDSSAAYGQYLFPAGPRNGASNLGSFRLLILLKYKDKILTFPLIPQARSSTRSPGGSPYRYPQPHVRR